MTESKSDRLGLSSVVIIFAIATVSILSGCIGCEPRFGRQPISEMPEYYWQKVNTAHISVDVGVGEKIWGIKGNIDKGNTVLRTVLTGGVGLLVLGVPRHEDEQFCSQAGGLAHSREFSPDKCALTILKRNLSLPPTVKPVYYRKGSWKGTPQNSHNNTSASQAEDIFLTVDITLLFEDTTSDHSFLEPSIRLVGRLSYEVMTREVLQRIERDRRRSKPVTTFWDQFASPPGDFYEGVYGNSYKSYETKTSSYKKGVWLSNEGHFMETQFKKVIEELVIYACQEINRTCENVGGKD